MDLFASRLGSPQAVRGGVHRAFLPGLAIAVPVLAVGLAPVGAVAGREESRADLPDTLENARTRDRG
jgi:hypothetical protein